MRYCPSAFGVLYSNWLNKDAPNAIRYNARLTTRVEHMLRNLLARLRSLLCKGMGDDIWSCIIAWVFIAILILLPFRHD